MIRVGPYVSPYRIAYLVYFAYLKRQIGFKLDMIITVIVWFNSQSNSFTRKSICPFLQKKIVYYKIDFWNNESENNKVLYFNQRMYKIKS